MALHQLIVQIGKALDQQETVLGVFLDTEGVFNNTSYDSMCDVLVRHGVDHIIVWWIRATWRAAPLWRFSMVFP